MGQERYCLAGREFSVNLDFYKGRGYQLYCKVGLLGEKNRSCISGSLFKK